MKIGILGCGYACETYIDKVFAPWKELKNDNLIISCVSAQFKEYEDLNIHLDNKATENKLNQYLLDGTIHSLVVPNEAMDEATARNCALKYLLALKCDYIWLLDFADEVYTTKEIIKTINYIEQEPFITWFRIEFKNLVFSEKTYVDGFRPPRIFKVRNPNNFILNSFYYDNDVVYYNSEVSNSYKDFSSLIIPKNICNPLHYTWLDNESSKNKIKYQEKRWGVNGCSFKWDNRLKWNEEYYKKTNQPIPTLLNV